MSMLLQLPVVIGLIFADTTLAAETYPLEVTEYINRREVCEHFRQEPWPEGSSLEDKERREFIATKFDNYCKGSDQALRELKRKYKPNCDVLNRLEKYEKNIEGPQ